MNQLVWWALVVQVGVAGSMGTIGSLNIQWWTQDHRERVLGFTGALCWAVSITLLIGTVGLAFQSETVWYAIVPVRAVLIGTTVALLLLTLSAVVVLPAVRYAVAASMVLPMIFAGLGLAGHRVYLFEGGSPWPHFQLLGNILVALSFLIFVAYCGVAIRQLSGVRRRQLGAAICTAVVVVAVATFVGPGLLAEALTTMWTVPIALLLAWWCSAHVLNLQGSLTSAIADRQLAQDSVYHHARHDPLTGLANETAGLEMLQRRIDAASPVERVVICRMQLTGLDQVRAVRGVKATDRLLQEIAEYLLSALSAGRDVAIFGESTFVLMDTIRRGLPISKIELRLWEGISDMRRSGVLPSELPVILGIAIATDSVDAAELVHESVIAVTAAEQTGRSVQTFRDDLRDGIVRQARTVRLMRAAVARDEFELHYQPVVQATTRRRVSVEALVRWRHHGRLHPPAEWIPIAEQHGLMPAIGLKVLQLAVRDHSAVGCPISVNVSPRQLVDPDFATMVLQSLRGCPPDALILEVTESSVIADPAGANRTLQALREHGIRIALDDFGTKYSSLSRLSSVPFDIIKIDRSFVSRVLTVQGRAMIVAIEGLARALGKATVAEGVETEEELAALREIGCDLVQGFLTGRPQPLDVLVESKTVRTGIVTMG